MSEEDRLRWRIALSLGLLKSEFEDRCSAGEYDQLIRYLRLEPLPVVRFESNMAVLRYVIAKCSGSKAKPENFLLDYGKEEASEEEVEAKVKSLFGGLGEQ